MQSSRHAAHPGVPRFFKTATCENCRSACGDPRDTSLTIAARRWRQNPGHRPHSAARAKELRDGICRLVRGPVWLRVFTQSLKDYQWPAGAVWSFRKVLPSIAVGRVAAGADNMIADRRDPRLHHPPIPPHQGEGTRWRSVNTVGPVCRGRRSTDPGRQRHRRKEGTAPRPAPRYALRATLAPTRAAATRGHPDEARRDCHL
jgi:hypothetical protein